jgi:hypothetical protein
MLISLLTKDLLFQELDPRHLVRLRLVNREFAKCINKDVIAKSVAAARTKYSRMIQLSEDTVRIHSVLGRTLIDLTLPTGEINERSNAELSMRFEGRLYHGQTMHWQCEMDGRKTDLSPYVFHAKSPRLLGAKNVFLVRRPIVAEGYGIYIRVVVEERNGVGRTFTLRFDH